jgi:hypothetical protein
MPTEAQKKATKKWVENHREQNIKRISECIQRRYETDEDFRQKKRDMERERQRVKREKKKLEEQADGQAEAEAEAEVKVEAEVVPQKKQVFISPIIYGF